jgi:hypothetical protein
MEEHEKCYNTFIHMMLCKFHVGRMPISGQLACAKLWRFECNKTRD